MARELNFRGLDLTRPLNRIAAGFCALAANVRAYLRGGFALRNPLAGAIYTLASAIHSIRRLNDSTPNGPAGGFSYILGAGTVLYNNNVSIATGMSGNPLSIIPFRPNTSVQPWAYVGDSAPSPNGTITNVTITTKRLYNNATTTFMCSGMVKVRSDGLIYKMGIEEPQQPPTVTTVNTNVTTTGVLEATAWPWTNVTGANSAYNYGQTSAGDGTAPFIINVANATSVTLTITGTATINGGSATPTTLGPSTSLTTNPGHFVQVEGTGVTPPATASVVIGAFTDGAGNVVPISQAPLWVSSVYDAGGTLGTAIPVPFGAQALQIGINSTGNTFSANSGSFTLSATVTTDALPPNTATLGPLTVYYWGDSPTSGPVANYIWKNPNDSGGSGPTRDKATAVGNTTGNSFIFDANFGTNCVPAQPVGIPGLPGLDEYSTNPVDTTVPMQWTILNPQSVNEGSNAVFQPAIKGVDGNTIYGNFNFCLIGNIFFPASGHYTFVLSYKDDVIWGIGGGATVVSSSGLKDVYNTGNPPTLASSTSAATSISDQGQTITVLSGLPLFPRVTPTNGEGGHTQVATVVVNIPAAGSYPIELDYDFWTHSGRILLLQASATPGGGATIIPPLPANVRENEQYRYTYYSSATGAESNPSPESTPISLPVTASTVGSLWSPDPQVDFVNYYRLDLTTADFTYVATGPNDDSSPPFNTSITDALLDTELGTKLLDYDNFEPFPSIDLPQKGTCTVSGGVITWLTGGAIGGTQTEFNIRWLAGTIILIGSPTSLAYVAVRRPTSTTSWDFTGADPEVPDQTDVVYQIAEPILAAQPLAYLFGPTDNINFTYGVGDPLRPGTLYWCKGSNLDAAPDTNQQDVTDPSEPLVNGAMSAGRGVLFSIRRAWIIAPNFFNALATSTGTTGSTWSLTATSIDRGLFIPRCVAVEGGGKIFFRVDDGVHLSASGEASQSITDQTLYPLFSHEGSTPVAVTRNGITVHPPDDALPQLQKFAINNGYLYYDYVDTTAVPRTLVFDIAAMGWILDITTPPATVHAPDEGESIQGCLVGCSDGSLRQFSSSGAETVTGTVLTAAIGGRGYMHFFETTVEYTSNATVTLTFIAPDVLNGSYGPLAVTLPSTGGVATKYTFKVGPNKWKWMQFQFVSTDPTLRVYLEGFVIEARAWGDQGPYKPMLPFASDGGEGAQT